MCVQYLKDIFYKLFSFFFSATNNFLYEYIYICVCVYVYVYIYKYTL